MTASPPGADPVRSSRLSLSSKYHRSVVGEDPKTRADTGTEGRFSEEYSKARFYKVDVDELPDVAQELGVRAMPTFIFFKDGQKVKSVVGADPVALEDTIKELAV